MGEKLYYIIEFLIFTGMIILVVKPELVTKNNSQAGISKLLSSKWKRIVIVFIALANILACASNLWRLCF